MPHLDITETVLVHRNILNNDYWQDSRVVGAFVSNKSFGKLLDFSIRNLIFLNTFNSEFSYIEVYFNNHIIKQLEIEDKINLTLDFSY